MDSIRSGVTASSRKQYRQELPRQTDLLTDVLWLMANIRSGEGIVFLVVDAEDAYWQIPLYPSERRYYCAILRMPDGRVR